MRRFALALILTTAAATHAADPPTITWDAAEQHIGEDVIVEGRVLGIHCSQLSCLLAFDPTFNRFTAVVQASSFKTFPPDGLNAQFVGRMVRVTGKMQLLDRKPEIVVSKPEDLVLVVTKEERAQEKQAAHDETLDRLDEILDRLDELTDRVIAAQQRLDQLALAMDQRAAQLEQLTQLMTPAPVEAPPEPSYGEKQPRPGYEALRSIKRGMSSDQVRRLVGEPIGVEAGSEGAYTWYYGYGRSIMFNARGRAESLVGFPGQ